MKNLSFLIALHSIDGLGTVRLKRLFDYFQDWEKAWNADDKTLRSLQIPQPIIQNLKNKRPELDPEKYLEKIQNAGIKLLTWFDGDYPQILKQLYDPPLVLYYKGEFKREDSQAIAVVGTRKVTGYGKLVTEKFSTELSQAGLTIVSGLARGVDTIAHRSALKAGGRTIAVLGGGLNKLFPPENASLVGEIIAGNGIVCSEVQNLKNISEMEKGILECLENENQHVDEIVRSLSKSSAEVSGTLIKLEIMGMVKNLGAGVYAKLA
jgi:DNA processing protein